MGIVWFRGVGIRRIDDGATEIAVRIGPNNQSVGEASRSGCEFVMHGDTLRSELPDAVVELR
jgi:hypothetical protein